MAAGDVNKVILVGRVTRGAIIIARLEPADVDDDLGASPSPLSIKRSAARYGDGLGSDDTDTSGLERFLSPDDQDRARLRAAGDDRRNSQ